MLLIQNQIKTQKNNYYIQRPDQQKGPFLIRNVKNGSKLIFRKQCPWTILQNAKYIAFIEQNLRLMQGKKHNELWEIYKEMSKFIKSRNFRQCKLHHQKLLNSYRTIPKISLMLKQCYPVIIEQIQKVKLKSQCFQGIYLKQQNQKFQKGVKQKDNNLMPTNITYQAEDSQQKDKNVYQNNNFLANKKQISYFSQFGNKILQKDFNMMYLNKDKSKQWQQCHNYFIQWMQKICELRNKPINF